MKIPDPVAQEFFAKLDAIDAIDAELAGEHHAERASRRRTQALAEAVEKWSAQEPEDDIRPIGELPEGTEVRYIHRGMTKEPRFVGGMDREGWVWLQKGGENHISRSPDYLVRVIRYPGPKPTGVYHAKGVYHAQSASDPAPKPKTALEQLPEGLRDHLVGRMKLGPDEREILARAILDHRDELFVAGEPVENLTLDTAFAEYRGSTQLAIGAVVSDDACVGIVSTGNYRPRLTVSDAWRAARRIAAFAKRGGK